MTIRELAIRIDLALVGGETTEQSVADRTWIIEGYHALLKDMPIHKAATTARREWLEMVLGDYIILESP